MRLLATLTVWLAAISAAQSTPVTITAENKSGDWAVEADGQRHRHYSYKISITNQTDKMIVGITMKADTVDVIGDKNGEQGFQLARKIKPGKKYDAYYNNDEYRSGTGFDMFSMRNHYTNLRVLAVKFEDGTVWRSTEDEQRSD